MGMSETEIYDFIRCCISHRPESERQRAVKSYIQAGPNWEVVLRKSSWHGVRPLFVHNLTRLAGKHLPSSLRDRIQELRHRDRINANFLIQELGKICRLCDERGLPIIALKGPVLAQVAYDDPAMRRYLDLDVLVPENRFAELDHLLRDVGYEYPPTRKKITGWRRTIAHRLKGQWQFIRAGGTFTIDVHTRLMPPGYSFPSDFEPFWNRARKVHLSTDVAVPALSREDEALALSYHGLKNQWRALKYVVDLAQLLRGGSPSDWSALLARARKVQATRVLGLGLSLAREILGTSLPKEIQKWSSRVPVDHTLSMLRSYLRYRADKSELSFYKRVRLQFMTKDTVMDRVRYAIYSIMQHLWATVLKP